MAQQVSFKPKPYTPLEDDRRHLEHVSAEHATAILNAYKLLREADDNGVLELLRGMISAKDIATSKAANFANSPNGVRTTRNLLALGKIIGSIDPDVLHTTVDDITTSVRDEIAVHRDRPPTLWGTIKRASSADVLRGLSLTVTALASVGRTLRRAEKG